MPRRSLREWLEVITECRSSGLSDSDWCQLNDIPIQSFYNAVHRLRKKACDIPEPTQELPALDLTNQFKQDVVPISIVKDHPVAAPVMQEPAALNIDNSHMIKISFGDATISIDNGADPVLLETVIHALRR